MYCEDKGIVIVEQLDYHRRCVLSVKHFTYPKATCANTLVKSNQSIATCANTPVKLDQSTATCANTPVKLHNHILICSAGTDGQLVLWDVTMVIQAWLDSMLGSNIEDDRVCPVTPLYVVPCHQSGINDVDIICITGNCKK